MNEPVKLASALIATGFSYDSASRVRQTAALAGVLPVARDIRAGGSAALALCWLAGGRHDAYLEDELELWDWPAGTTIAAEAGALVVPYRDGILAGGPALVRALTPLLTT